MTLSTTSVYPESTADAFARARAIGYDGVELMVGIDPIAADVDRIVDLSAEYGVKVWSIHAPCLLVTPNVWGSDPWGKLDKAAEAAGRLGSKLIVVHPPFRWQRDYAGRFEEGIAELNEKHAPLVFAVENMYPWRTPAGRFAAYSPGFDPTNLNYDHLVLDLSHAATAQMDSRTLVARWGSRLRHIHLTDGSGAFKDEHLLPGQGNQHAWEVAERAVAGGFNGDIVLEVNTRKLSGEGVGQDARFEALSEALMQTRMAVDRGIFARRSGQVREGARQ
ncbi:sugar phosphate isomerase/epimerase family protein [Cutibacterium modestum]|uniref:sugar phosphate isomerase/epimerase family protein n=1 Tax=Cutibacterium modestum TaxID=2559073 RepID=UPI000F056EB6|nr:sugar phosphate isomerase/epimerase family protein [Cutibacterium modestum]